MHWPRNDSQFDGKFRSVQTIYIWCQKIVEICNRIYTLILEWKGRLHFLYFCNVLLVWFRLMQQQEEIDEEHSWLHISCRVVVLMWLITCCVVGKMTSVERYHRLHSNWTHDLLSRQKMSNFSIFWRIYSIPISVFWWVMIQWNFWRKLSL